MKMDDLEISKTVEKYADSVEKYTNSLIDVYSAIRDAYNMVEEAYKTGFCQSEIYSINEYIIDNKLSDMGCIKSGNFKIGDYNISIYMPDYIEDMNNNPYVAVVVYIPHIAIMLFTLKLRKRWYNNIKFINKFYKDKYDINVIHKYNIVWNNKFIKYAKESIVQI